MIKKHHRLLAMILSLVLLTSCWDSLDIDKHDIVVAVVIDYKENKYDFYTEIAALTGGSASGRGGEQSGQQKFEVLHAQGDNLIEARDELNRRSDHPIYLGATRAVVLSHNFAKNGIEEYLNRMRGDIYYRKPVFLVTTSTEPEKLLKDKPENSPAVGDAIENTLDNLDKSGGGCSVSVGNALEALALKTVGFFLPDMNTTDNETTVTGYSIFKDAKKIGLVDAKDRNGMVYLICRDAEFLYTLDYKGRKITFGVKLSKRKIKPVLADNEVRFTVDVSVAASLEYIDKMTRYTKEEISMIMKLLQSEVKEDIQKTIEESQQKYRCDYLHFYKFFRAYKPKVFREMNWNTIYSQAKIDVTVKAKLKETGLTELKPKT